MSTFVRFSSLLAGSVAMTGLVVGAVPVVAHGAVQAEHTVVTRASTPGCGYDGRVNGEPTYRHCGTGSVVIEVDHVFWQHTYACMPPGVHTIPQGTSSWAIDGADYDGHTCSYTVPISIVGP
jgi:hypothetical protein